MSDTVHLVLVFIIAVGLLLFFAAHTTETDSLMQTGVKGLTGVESGFSAYAQGKAPSPPAYQ